MIGEKLKLVRQRKGYSLAYMGGRLGINRQTYFNYEKGMRSIQIDTLEKICNILDIPYLDLLASVQDEYIEYLKNHKDDMEIWF